MATRSGTGDTGPAAISASLDQKLPTGLAIAAPETLITKREDEFRAPTEEPAEIPDPEIPL